MKKEKRTKRTVTLVLLTFLLISVFAPLIKFPEIPLVRAADGYFGNTDTAYSGTTTYTQGAYKTLYTLGSEQLAYGMQIYCDSASTEISEGIAIGIYNGTDLLGQVSVTVPADDGWAYAALATNITLSAGEYGLGVKLRNPNSKAYYTTSGAEENQMQGDGDLVAGDPLPNPFSLEYEYTREHCVLVNYTDVPESTYEPTLNDFRLIGEKTGANSNISALWSPASGSTLSHGIFCWNDTGTPTNQSAVDISSILWNNVSLAVTAGNDDIVQIIEYANSSTNDWTTETFYFIPKNDTIMLHNDDGILRDEDGEAYVKYSVGKIHYDDDPTGWWNPYEKIWNSGYNNYNETAIDENLAHMQHWGINTVRIHMKASWWEQGNVTLGVKTTDYQNSIKRLAEMCADRGMYLNIDVYNFDNGDSDFTNVIDNSTGFLNFWGNFTEEMRVYSNVIFELYNEPNPSSEAELTQWAALMNLAIARIRSVGATNPIICMGSLTTIPHIGWMATMEWALPEHYTFTDPIGDNLIMSGHLYRTYYNPIWHDAYDYDNCSASMEDCAFRDVMEQTHRPVVVGEIGVNMWSDDTTSNGDSGLTNLEEECAWALNVFTYMNNITAGYSAWNWIQNGGDQWYLLTGGTHRPTKWGHSLIQGINNDNPFVWGVGASNTVSYIYHNETSWSSTWSNNKLNVTYTGNSVALIYWNVSDSYPINSTLKILHSNGTVYNALDYYSNTPNLLMIYGSGSGSWAIGYGDYILTMQTTTGGSINPTAGDYLLLSGVNQTIVATPSEGYQFAAWEIDGANETTTQTTWHVYMDSTHTAKAYFKADVGPPPPATSLSVALNTPASSYVSYLWTVDFTYVPQREGDAYIGAYLWLNGSNVGGNQSAIINNTVNTISYTFLMNGTYYWNIQVWNSTDSVLAEQNRTVILYFTDYYLTMQSPTAGGSVSPTAGTVRCYKNSVQSLVGTPDAYALLTAWEVDGSNVSTAKTYDLTMNSNHTAKAYFTSYPEPATVSLGSLWTFLFEGDFIGFFYALLASTFTFLSLGIALVVMLFLTPLYLRTNSLLLLCIAWLLIGSFLIALMPEVAGLAVLFIVLGVAGLIYRLFRPGSNS